MRQQPAHLRVTDTTMVCTGLHLVAADLATAICEWLHAHNLDEHQVLAGEPIIRNPENRTVTWTQVDKGRPVTVVDHPPIALPADAMWPAPFPDLLLQQIAPPHCPTCLRPFDTEEDPKR